MEKVICDWYKGDNIPVETRLPLTAEQRALAEEICKLKAQFTATFSRQQDELYEVLCDREALAELRRETAIFAQGVGFGLRLAFEALEK